MILKIEGMHCDACVRRVRLALEKTGRGTVGEVRVGQAELAAPADAAPVLIAALGKAGFPAQVAG
jgi:copper chaperone CopZ